MLFLFLQQCDLEGVILRCQIGILAFRCFDFQSFISCEIAEKLFLNHWASTEHLVKYWKNCNILSWYEGVNSFFVHFTGQRPKHAYRRCRYHTSYDRSFSRIEDWLLEVKGMTDRKARFLQVHYVRYAAKIPVSARVNGFCNSIGCMSKVINLLTTRQGST